MKKILRRIQGWFHTRVVHCHTCGSTSGRLFPDSAERVARNHSHFTGHARVTVNRNAS